MYLLYIFHLLITSTHQLFPVTIITCTTYHRSKANIEKARKMKEEINEVIKKRVNLSLHTPNVNLTSHEAMVILDEMNTTDTVKMTDIIRFRHTVSYEIEQLQDREAEYQKSKDSYNKVNKDIQQNTISLEQAKANAQKAVEAEERARKALDDATKLVARTKQDVDDSTFLLSSASDRLTQNEIELTKHFSALAKQQKRVRIALRRKDEELPGQSKEKMIGDFKANKVDDSYETIQELLKEEKYLAEESTRLEAMAQRLESRAQKLEEKANEMEKGEDAAWIALEESVKVAEEAAKAGYGKFDTSLKDKNGININK